jgi:hypothetical protein
MIVLLTCTGMLLHTSNLKEKQTMNSIAQFFCMQGDIDEAVGGG